MPHAEYDVYAPRSKAITRNAPPSRRLACAAAAMPAASPPTTTSCSGMSSTTSVAGNGPVAGSGRIERRTDLRSRLDRFRDRSPLGDLGQLGPLAVIEGPGQRYCPFDPAGLPSCHVIIETNLDALEGPAL